MIVLAYRHYTIPASSDILGTMKPSIQVIRAVGASFANRVFYPVLITCIVLTTGTAVVVVWLTTLSQWWWLLGIPVVMGICVLIGVLAITKLVIRTVTPIQTKPQKHAVKLFVDKLQRLSEATQTPKFILLFRIVRDIAAPSEKGYIGELARDTLSLKQDYNQLVQLFSRP